MLTNEFLRKSKIRDSNFSHSETNIEFGTYGKTNFHRHT